ncbi:MAG TPA: VOC family protein [Alphaproteobacteria bacterium]|nr:VOC family protein [Alphaproteobacteria bacterium]
MKAIQKITPCLWFDSAAEEAARFYVSVFKNARIGRISHYGVEGFKIHGRPEGSVMTVEFEIAGRAFTALNGGPHFKFNEAISFQIPCETQKEIDHYWERLSADGEIQQCGWLKDRLGVSWQIFPAALPEMLRDPDKAARAMRAMLGMKKLDIAELRAAYEGK